MSNWKWPLTSTAINPLFQGKSANSPGFLFAVLYAEGVVERDIDNPRVYVVSDISAFTAEVEQLMGSEVNIKVEHIWAEAHDGQWPNVMDMPMVWDSCTYLDESAGDPQWVIFLLCWNNAGGPVYYVPQHLWEAARVTEHIEATNRAWNP